jgi:hypothetical protein
MKCQTEICNDEATCAVCIDFPIKGSAIPMRFVLGLKVCEPHAYEFNVSEFINMNPVLIDLLNTQSKKWGQIETHNVKARPIPLDSEEYRILTK